MKNIESKIQIACVNWFRYQYPQFRKLLFSVPNGGVRNSITGAILKAEGALSGVSDLILLIPNKHYASLCIEMKQPKGVQRDSQKEWQKAVEEAGINQTRHTIFLKAATTLQIVAPTGNRSVEVEHQIAIAESIIVGEVPESYFQFGTGDVPAE